MTENFKGNKNKIIQYTTLWALLYHRENWTIKAYDTRRITAVEMKCMIKR